MRFSKMNNRGADDKLAREIVELMRSDDSVDAPAESVAWAKNLFRMRAIGEQEQPSLIKKIVAALSIDLSAGRPALAERSAGAAAKGRQMLFEAEGVSIDIRISGGAKGKRFDLQGQLLGELVASTVELSGPDFNAVETVGELSDFGFKNVPAGTYDLTIRTTDGTEIIIPGLAVE